MSRTRPRHVALLAVAAVLGALLTASPEATRSAVADATAYAGTQPASPLALVSRLARHPALARDATAMLGVRVGGTVHEAYWAQWGPGGCHAVLWLVVVDRRDGASVFDDNGTGGLIAPACDPGAVQAAVGRIVALGSRPLVVVNTIAWAQPDCGSVVYPTLGTDLAPLGFADTAALNGLDWCGWTLTGVGAPGQQPGDAWQQGYPVSGDSVGSATAAAPTPGSVALNLSPGPDGMLTPFDFSAKVARAYLPTPGDGSSGGWLVDGTRYPSAPLPAGTRGGFQLLVLTTSSGVLGLVANLTVWTATPVVATDDAQLARVAGYLQQYDQRQNVLLLRSIGQPKGAVTTAAGDPGIGLAFQVDRMWGLYGSVTSLAPGTSLTVAFPGGLPHNVTAVTRVASHAATMTGTTVTTPPARLPVTVETSDVAAASSGDDARTAWVLLRQSRVGRWYQPARIATGRLDPYVLDEALTTPDSAWPTSATPGLAAAYVAWSQVLCSCADARTVYTSGRTGGWPAALDVRGHPYVPTVAYTAGDWEQVRAQLTREVVDVGSVGVLWNHLRSLVTVLTGSGSLSLVSVANAFEAQFATDAGVSLASLRGKRIAFSVLDATLVAAILAPYVGWAGALATGAWTAAAFTMNWDAPTPTGFQGAVADLAQGLVDDAAQTLAGMAAQIDRVVTDPGRLALVGSALRQATNGSPWYVPTGVDQEATALTAAVTAGLYRRMMPLYYQVWVTTDGLSGPAAKWNPASYYWTGSGNDEAFLDVPGPRAHVGAEVVSGNEPPDLQPGDWYLATLARYGVSPHMTPPSDALLDRVRAAGVPLETVFRQWPMRHLNCATGRHPPASTNGWGQQPETGWSHPDTCEPYPLP